MTNLKRALFIKTKHLGDSVILTSAIEALPDEWVVDVFCYPDSKEIFELNSRVDNIFVSPRHLNGFSRIKHYLSTYLKMRSMKYDLLAQFSDDWRGAFFARFLNVKLSVAKHNTKRPKFWFKSFNQIAKLSARARHASEQDVDLLRKVGLYKEAFAPKYAINISSENLSYVRNLLENTSLKLGNKRIVIHSSSRWKFKTMSVSFWVNLVDALQASGFQVILSGAPSDYDFNQAIIERSSNPPSLMCDLSIAKTAALYKCADLIITIDSMSVHLASAIGIPTVALFGPSNSIIWGPHIAMSKVISSSNHSCVPCGIDGCGGGKVSHCLESISINEILDNVQVLLSKSQ